MRAGEVAYRLDAVSAECGACRTTMEAGGGPLPALVADLVEFVNEHGEHASLTASYTKGEFS